VSPAKANQLIIYRGRSSDDHRVVLYVVKKDSGRRFLRGFVAKRLTLTCEDATTHRVSLTVASRLRLGEEGTFELMGGDEGGLQSYAYSIEGLVRFRLAEGTLEFNAASLDDLGNAQLCTTGVLDWSAERVVNGRLSMAMTDSWPVNSRIHFHSLAVGR
jgi:hypothetical protein